MVKTCKTCQQPKDIAEFFCAPQDGAAAWGGTSTHCIKCHEMGLVNHGYGYYGDKYRSPALTTS